MVTFTPHQTVDTGQTLSDRLQLFCKCCIILFYSNYSLKINYSVILQIFMDIVHLVFHELEARVLFIYLFIYSLSLSHKRTALGRIAYSSYKLFIESLFKLCSFDKRIIGNLKKRSCRPTDQFTPQPLNPDLQPVT